MTPLLRALNADVRKTGVDTLAYAPVAVVETRRTFEDRPTVVDRCTGYRMQIQAYVNFWTNQPQYADAHRNAEQQLIGFITGPVTHDLHRAKSALFAGDVAGAQRILDAAIAALEGRV